MKIILKNETDTAAFAQQLADMNLTGSVWLSGDLGAGKTTLTRYWLQAMGHTGAVKSPTYTLVEPYQIQTKTGIKPVYHADLYRLNDPEELDYIGFFEYFDEHDSLVIIEWASRAESNLPKPDYLIDLTRQADDCRVLEFIKAS
ncbi:tRNA (adenosine(37)-N6)-threonylcarbamoyltransferase complex ATPase subunit type 1 TsaE [Moraxella sp. FZLJ2107]|uniref:tRNA (adenosine(37)-N6)-threonylcarbamoyltransferase complex ATPase subunit type 1 TsaE n=1 Tax=unclassified Moraxella TaxID=2685852 RepID=UPI00209BD088|nr:MULTISPECIES: tRNA (adenosine(37)-N6)-threonylcarbamoyltransferase complex ATPase subunit type 1 TsaE [unclassified Moraxella]USZ14682.1 tRNA (adenosine(37)-N6)-threonylcarbamoyltransferase complex ATPase subunit type 1 TsaE [Moraxella sp. FZFQ2102]UTO05523.1 tRNA (adenosine(37)-N6)-threonylcarbamoyltransferase complex ATPase subunit type 1 TsaE [Moraxella sp. FZLJ2107]UTO22259.1 tRNA (adenosine(37)-N6)-threonylcarbamoyltransferase complex ATPase subunit type 1 TsaE [Moraxella sp. FZLJ2109]